MNQGLHDQLCEALMALVFAKISEQKKEKLLSRLAYLKNNVKNAKSIDVKSMARVMFCYVLLLGFVVSGTIYMYIIRSTDLPNYLGTVLFILMIAAVGAVSFTVRYFALKKSEKERDLEIITQETVLFREEPLINADILKIDEALIQSESAREAAIAFLPSKYREIYIIDFLLESVKNLRADTLKEAINLYEAHLSDMELKNQLNQMQMATQMQTEQLEIMNNYMEQINRNQAQMSDDIADIKYTQYLEWLRNS